MNPLVILLSSFCYIGLIFYVGWRVNQNLKFKKQNLYGRIIYTLSIGVYCSAWTYYGAVGMAYRSGLEYLAVYSGPAIATGFWWIILRKIIRITKVFKITNLADFYSTRYGKNFYIGIAVALICFVGISPYIALQIKAIASSTTLISSSANEANEIGIAFFYVIICGFFLFFLTFKKDESNNLNQGLMAAIAAESVIKIVLLLLTCIYIIYCFIQANENYINLNSLFVSTHSKSSSKYSEWFTVNFLSFLAIFFLPRQFHTMVIENENEHHIKHAIIYFSLYLMLCSILITPVANTLHYFIQNNWNPDYYILQFSIFRSNYVMALITYIGGISAATSMIIISSFSLSIMISHNVIFPFLIKIKNKFKFESIDLGKLPELSKYISIALVLSSSYLFFAGPAFHANLSSIGLLSFAAVAQLAPAGIGAIFWKEGNFFGAISGMIAGFLLWLLTLAIPFVISNSIVEHDFGLIVLSNYINYSLKNFIGMSEMGLLSYGVMLSLSINTLLYIIVSLYTPTNSSEKNQAEVFVDIFQYSRVYESAIAWKGKASAPDLINLLVSFIGEKRTNELLDEYSSKYGTSWKSASEAEPKFVNFIENSLSNVIGNASARLLINSIVDEDEIKHREVVELLYKAQQLLRDHRELRETYNKLNEAKIELEKANSKLKEQDILKDEFLSTVAHELRTPITSIRALCEIIASEPNMEESQRAVFLQIIIDESIRISKIIDSVLDLEKYEAGNQILNASLVELKELIHYAINQFVITSSVKFEVLCSESLKPVILDRDKITQLLINLISNSIKHNSVSDLVITITASITNDLLVLIVQDNGCGIDETDLPYIFDKFYQSMNKKYIKSNSSGLGLAICKKIVTLHGGTIEATNHSKGGAVFRICLPVSFD